MKALLKFFFSVALLFLMVQPVLAQTGVGKLSGRILDAQTREPLIGANIVILGSDYGAATNVRGEYFILNIPPGTYEVRFSYVGYGERTVTDVRVVAGVTYELNMELTAGIELREVVVAAERKFFEEKATNTKKVLDSEEINRLPVRGVERLASLQSGVVMAEGSGGQDGNATINVRGGRGNEVLYIVDGVPQNDIYTGANYSQVSNSAIEQLAFEVSGFEAKYGQAQSGIVNVTTKSGDKFYSLFGDVLSSTFTDDYGYNLYTLNLSGPLFPGQDKHTIFLSGERGWFLDADPHAVPLSFNSDVVRTTPATPHNDASVWRYTARTTHRLGDFNLRLGANINQRSFRGYVHSYTKNNAEHNPKTERLNMSFSGRLSQNLSASSFWNINVGFRQFSDETGDGQYFDNLYLYGDSLAAAQRGVYFRNSRGERTLGLPAPGQRVGQDPIGIFFERGRVSNGYIKNENQTISADLDFTSQIENHLVEIGGGMQYNTLRYYAIAPVGLSSNALRNVSEYEKFRRQRPTVFGYDIFGNRESVPDSLSARNPIIAYAYLQDRFELSDIVLNVGLRADYFDTQADQLANPELPFAAGNPNIYDEADFVRKKPEFYLSPRIGLGFPITANTVFHAQYGKFIQQPPLNNLYSTIMDLDFLRTDNAGSVNTGHISSEITTSYEVGFRHSFDDRAAINITAFYKNTEGLINVAPIFFQRTEGGEQLDYYAPTNTDFGTVKGLAVSLDVARVSFFSASVDYTYSLAEGTGSSTGSSFIAAFRNYNNEIPKVIAPLDFDQRHTGVINFDFYVPKDNLGFLELTNANLLVSFNSGRPYTPLVMQNLLAGSSNFGDTRGYVNSAYGPGNFRVDLKVEKSFRILGNSLITPYVWIENLFDAVNTVDVYRSTGSPYTTGWLETEEGRNTSAGQPNPSHYREDYMSLERNPFNFGIPRLIRLGLKFNLSNLQL
jgi:hypothetical protein